MHTLLQLQSGELAGATSLKLSEGLSQFPREIFDLADTLEKLDLSGNNLSTLPADFGRLHKLKILFCSDNLFTVLPEVVGHCPLLDIVGFKANKINTIPPVSLNPNLRWLILTDNRVDTLPAEIGNCIRMQKLMLAGNQLKDLPFELSRCRNLALLRISANQLSALPEWLLSMPKLAWLAFSGNPFSQKPVVQPLHPVDWKDLAISHVLGEGASGVILKATLQNADNPQVVAVKVFKGAVTSDGLPEDEMDASIAAGIHPGLVRLIGQINTHPENKKGLVMELIPERFYNLGLPPSLASCSRDVFRDGFSLTGTQIVKIASTIASVAEQLHSHGIMHSDLYAHNTMIDDDGNTLFGDFGAACFYGQPGTDTSAALERIEVRAYGYLLDDLLTLCEDAKTNAAISKVTILRDLCLTEDVLSRPQFKYLNQELAQL
jgi:hypothetical protein